MEGDRDGGGDRDRVGGMEGKEIGVGGRDGGHRDGVGGGDSDGKGGEG